MILKLAFILFGIFLVLWGIYSRKKYESFLEKLTGIGRFLGGITCMIAGILSFIIK
ncbi:hypothetical protein BWGOE8_53210 [Bacillus mycoides]|uniref:DUF3953 domain-containing protein n=1 Tax=Bacillus mycoides TaxID=1405 RepID=A0A1E8AZK4_BACMY|nr:hypothetical protein BWGOE8_53210 [Bacillus mycoides]OFD74433.1 hypothetical protein BWGOE10_53820 [Bacillus mycoides]OFD79136.1 hypothetical protein BWGOE9_25890 [Bacillus mycoides]